MQPEEILKLLESNDKAMRLEGISAYFEFLIPPKSDDSSLEEEENNNKSAYRHTKLWKTIRRRTWDHDEADGVIIQFFEYIMRRFKTGNKILNHEELTKEKKAPVINNLEAFAFWKCNLLITDYERKMGRRREKEVVTDKAEELGQKYNQGKYFETKGLLSFKQEKESTPQLESLVKEENNHKLIADCIQNKLREFATERSPDGAEVIGMQVSGNSIAQIAKFRRKSISATKEFIRISKIRAKPYLEPCSKINTYSKAIKIKE
jgi:hypothetical protein